MRSGLRSAAALRWRVDCEMQLQVHLQCKRSANASAMESGLTCHEGALALCQLTLHISKALQSVGQLVPLLLQQGITYATLLLLFLQVHIGLSLV